MDGWLDGWIIDVWEDGWMDGRMDGWTDRKTCNDAVSSSDYSHQTVEFKNNLVTKCGIYYHCTGTQGLGK